MPELPEVETIVRGLNKEIVGRKILGIWTDWQKLIKFPKKFDKFESEVTGRKIMAIKRRGKNILIFLDQKKVILVHQKMTGHLLVGRWSIKNNQQSPLLNGVLEERVNNYIHLVFDLSGKLQLALSDLRKFAKVMAGGAEQVENAAELQKLGPEPLDKTFTFERFKERMMLKNGKIKQVLMDQSVIAGIGNIYSDEILWQAKIHPIKKAGKLKDDELRRIYLAIKEIFKKSISLKGDSMSDFRDIFGKKGRYQLFHKVYQRTGLPCFRDKTPIERFKIGGRNGHYCPTCQQ